MLTPRLNETPVRVLPGLLLVINLSGYSLIAALFPRRGDLNGVERIALSFGLGHRYCAADQAGTQLHSVRGPAGTSACRDVRVHDLACSGCWCAAGAGFRGGAVLWSRDGGWGVVETIAMVAGAGEVGWRERVWCGAMVICFAEMRSR